MLTGDAYKVSRTGHLSFARGSSGWSASLFANDKEVPGSEEPQDFALPGLVAEDVEIHKF